MKRRAMRRRPRWLLLLPRGGCLAILCCCCCCCSLLTNLDESKLTENSYDRCRDHVDNDGDGLVDCDDPGCAPFSFCAELSAAACSDGVDNDGDALVDCRDPGCAALPGVCVEQTSQACSDGVDNDGDALVDCADPDCQRLDLCQEKSDAACSDGIDNNHNGLVDCADFDCYSSPPCCPQAVPFFTGGSFSFASSCTVRACADVDPSCCKAPYQTCSPFDPARWVAWGLPRALQEGGAFVANERCGCEPSGVVSVEQVRLEPGLALSFELQLDRSTASLGSVCAGLTRSTTFVDDQLQCSGAAPPQLLVGVCLEWAPGGARQVSAIVDGVVEDEQAAPGIEPLRASIRVTTTGAELTAGSLAHRTTPLDVSLDRALVLVTGRGTAGRVRDLSAQEPGSSLRRCQDPSAWYRHLGRGEPVVAARDQLSFGQPSVVYLPESKAYLMLVAGTGGAGAQSALYAAKSSDGVGWTVSPGPVIGRLSQGADFGARQSSPALLLRQGRIHVWFTREDDLSASVTRRRIAHATSTDGATWVPSGLPLEAGTPPAWDSLAVSAPSVVEAPDGALLMWYTGTALEVAPRPAIGVARSTDGGESWTRLRTQSVVAPDAASPDLACEEPSVLYDPARRLYLMWYTHRTFGRNVAIRFAVSPDGLAWVRWPKGAALDAGPLGAFDERGVEAPAVLGDPLRVWYTGVNGKGTAQVGYAENRGSR